MHAHLHRTLLSAALAACVLAGCERSNPAADAATPPASKPVALADVELIPRDALFGNPERANVQISPDGKYLSWVAAVDGVMNVWVAPADDLAKAKAVTDDKARGIREYFWSHRPDTLLYMRDTGGDENFHLFSVDLASGQARDLSNFPKTRAYVVGVSHLHPDSVLVGMNDRDPSWHDLYRVDLASGQRTLVQKNTGEFASYIADPDYKVRMATKARADGGSDLLEPDGKGGWKLVGDIPFSDSLTTAPGGFTVDGKTQYFIDSRGRDTAALYAIDTASGAKTLVAEDARADIGGSLDDPKTGKAQAVSIDYLKNEWKVVDPAIAADLEKLKAVGPGDISVNARTLDDKTWIVAYSAAETPVAYYRYVRGGTPEKLFSARPALEGKPLVPMWPQEIKSRDGLTLVSYLTLPKHADANADGKADATVPMVLLVHGGPWARDGYGYSGYTQWLANRGYAVLQPNFRGSTGYGRRFLDAGNKQWGEKMQDDKDDGAAWLVKEGIADPKRLAIFGYSYGGFAAAAAVVRPNSPYQCAIAGAPVTDLNKLGWSWSENRLQRILQGKTVKGMDPMLNTDKANIPVLLYVGDRDVRTPAFHAESFYEAVNGKVPAKFALVADMPHSMPWYPRHQTETLGMIESFLKTDCGPQGL